MTDAVHLVDVWRGEMVESRHRGHAVIADARGRVVAAWGDPAAVIYPRSSCKMLQALPLLESGAGARLTSEQLALACASHKGAAIHVSRVAAWLGELGLRDADLRCGPQVPDDAPERHRLRDAGEPPCQAHNNCSGKHAGFLTLTRHLGADAEYVEIDHPVQRAVRDAFEDMTGEESPAWAIDGCSAPNFACTVAGIATAAARMGDPSGLGGTRATAARALVDAMRAHPLLISGEGGACSELMAAMRGRVAVKTGAEAVFVAILPERGLGVALKIEDGGVRGSECAVTTLLARLGAIDPADPAAARRMAPVLTNRRGMPAARIAPHPALWADGAPI